MHRVGAALENWLTSNNATEAQRKRVLDAGQSGYSASRAQAEFGRNIPGPPPTQVSPEGLPAWRSQQKANLDTYRKSFGAATAAASWRQLYSGMEDEAPEDDLVSFEHPDMSEGRWADLYADNKTKTARGIALDEARTEAEAAGKSGRPVKFTFNQQRAVGEKVTSTLAEGEGKSRAKGGEIPTEGSGVTWGRGVDAKHLTTKQLIAAGATPEKIAELEPYLGKDKLALRAAGLSAERYDASRPEMSTALSDNLAFALMQEHRKVNKQYTGNLSETGKEVTISLRHWAGRLGNSPEKAIKMEAEGKAVANKLLVMQEDSTRINPVWNALKGKTATDKDLLTAMRATYNMYPVGESGDWKRERMRKEMKKIAGKDVVPIIRKKKKGTN